MESKELDRHLLGIIEPWTVERIDLDMTQGRIDVHVGHSNGVLSLACEDISLIDSRINRYTISAITFLHG